MKNKKYVKELPDEIHSDRYYCVFFCGPALRTEIMLLCLLKLFFINHPVLKLVFSVFSEAK
jgi:hypothetical protein